MNLLVFKEPDPSGKMYKESFLFKNYPEEYEFVINYSKSNNIVDVMFKEMVYLAINNINTVPICRNLNCENKVRFKNSTIGYLKYCSNICISSDPLIKKLKEEKSISKYGTKSPSQSLSVKNKIKKTNIEKYGGNSPMSSKDIQVKSKETLMSNYGVTNPSKSEEIKLSRIKSFKLSNYRESYKSTSIKRYGVIHPWMNKDIHKKTIDFFYSDYRSRIESRIDKSMFKFIDFRKDITTYLQFKCFKCEKNFEILTYQFYYRTNNNTSICTNCFPISQNSSISQKEVYDFISDNYSGVIEYNCKKAISPYEIDIYLPELKIGFEFNGVWWHSDKFKNERYHLDKINIADNNKISLFSIWEDDWNIKREIVKSYILNKINISYNRFFARKCEILEISYNDSKEFLNNNHLQGDCKSSIRLGLFCKGELISLMTFSKLRLPLQKSSKSRNMIGYYELTRFCNRTNTTVVGGASKLLYYFIKKYSPVKIETYSDNLISKGDLYKTLGFSYIHTSKPGYWYLIDGIRVHRFNWRKQRLVKMGYDCNKTGEEIMNELGYYRIYNAGNKKWELKLD